jgi:DNA-binding response OmpR family regulator
MQVLVVEDDPISQRILTSYLGKWGYDSTVVTDGQEAWELLQTQDYPIVISDWMLPGLNGVELVRRIRDWRSPHGQIYTVLLTGKSAKEDLVAAMDAGADDFISKPFDRDELRVRLREGARMVEWDRTVQRQASEIVSQLEAVRALLQAGLSSSPERALQVIRNSQDALSAAYQAARQLDRTLQPGDAGGANDADDANEATQSGPDG